MGQLVKYLSASLRVDILVELQLLLLSFCIGIQDAISFPDFHCFASNQTGNSVVLAVGIAKLSGDLFDLSNVGMSLSAFISGAIITGQLARLVGRRRRAWLLLSHSIQTIMTFAAAATQAASSIQDSTSWHMRAAIALLAFASGSQVASMRPMQIPEITTAMATAAWVDLVIDPNLLAIRNRSRNRRIGFLVALITGSFAGAFMYASIGAFNALVVSGIGKSVVTASFLFNEKEDLNCVSEDMA